jgi:amidohydrolase
MVYKHFETLHRMPELSMQEIKTSAYICSELTKAGYAPVRVGETGLYADLCTDPNRPWLLFRADMDALPVLEETGLPYTSETAGMMHACGHDAHTAMLLTAATLLKGCDLPQNIRFLFQPGEEITAGAKAMVDAGAMHPDTVAAFGFHVWPKVPKGKIVAKSGALMASSTRIKIRCVGKNAHCSKRQEGADALLTAATIATRFHEAEAMAGNDGTVLFCGMLKSGTAHNIVSGEAEMLGTLRSYSEQSRELVLKKLSQIVAESAATFGTEAQLHTFAYNPAVINPDTLTINVQTLFPEALCTFEPSLASEDFSRYQHVVPSVFLWLGVGETAALHNGKFTVPEEILPIGVDAWVRLANHKW